MITVVKIKKLKNISDESEVLIVKILEQNKKYKYTVQWGDGENHEEDTLLPFIESEFVFNSIDEAYNEAECDISDYFEEE